MNIFRKMNSWFKVTPSHNFSQMAEEFQINLDEILKSGVIDKDSAKVAFIRAIVKRIAADEDGFLNRKILGDVQRLPTSLLKEEKENR